MQLLEEAPKPSLPVEKETREGEKEEHSDDQVEQDEDEDEDEDENQQSQTEIFIISKSGGPISERTSCMTRKDQEPHTPPERVLVENKSLENTLLSQNAPLVMPMEKNILEVKSYIHFDEMSNANSRLGWKSKKVMTAPKAPSTQPPMSPNSSSNFNSMERLNKLKKSLKRERCDVFQAIRADQRVLEQQMRKYLSNSRKKKLQQRLKLNNRESGGFDLRDIKVNGVPASDDLTENEPNFNEDDIQLIDQI